MCWLHLNGVEPLAVGPCYSCGWFSVGVNEFNEINGRHIPIFLVLSHFVCGDILWPLGDVLVLTRGLHQYHHRPTMMMEKAPLLSIWHFPMTLVGCETEAEASAFGRLNLMRTTENCSSSDTPKFRILRCSVTHCFNAAADATHTPQEDDGDDIFVWILHFLQQWCHISIEREWNYYY